MLTRAEFRAGAETLIPGLVVEGGPLPILVRAIGPALAAFGVERTAGDPALTVFAAHGARLAANGDWGASAQAALLPGLFRAHGAFDLPAGSRDAAIATTLPVGAVTVPVSPGATAGTGLVEIYETAAGPGRLRNLSTRGAVDAAGQDLIVGFVIAGAGGKRVLLRAAGPALTAFGVPGVLRDPELIVIRSAAGGSAAAEVARNDNWPITVGEASVAAGAFAFAPGSLDAALVIVLPAGAYTARVTSRDSSGGVALLELYDLDP